MIILILFTCQQQKYGFEELQRQSLQFFLWGQVYCTCFCSLETKIPSICIHFFSGDCNDDQECICVEQELKGDHVKCVSDAVCKMYCQFDQKARTGKCGGDYGWDCVCSDNDEKNEIDGI